MAAYRAFKAASNGSTETTSFLASSDLDAVQMAARWANGEYELWSGDKLIARTEVVGPSAYLDLTI